MHCIYSYNTNTNEESHTGLIIPYPTPKESVRVRRNSLCLPGCSPDYQVLNSFFPFFFSLWGGGLCMEVREILMRVGFLLLPFGLWELKLGCAHKSPYPQSYLSSSWFSILELTFCPRPQPRDNPQILLSLSPALPFSFRSGCHVSQDNLKLTGSQG